MFVLAAAYSFLWPVTVETPDPAVPGAYLQQTFKVRFEPLSKEQGIALDEEFRALETLEERIAHEHDLLFRTVRDWEDVVDPSTREPVPFTDENFRTAMRFPWFPTGLYRAYRDAMTGDKARLGN
ncbi:MAG TPA: hypothetical protein VLA00_14560 [Xanthobacteraceae bacterium]|nr:hypothetical protein [Xanthobacteraceae bacterium]